ncbi:MAG: V-type ATP synthase subunit B [Clostridia bacterium]|nr:V-type ATP synthase subunit B [Clostridia bacterium]
MRIEYLGIEGINGPLIFIETPKEISYNEQVELILKSGEHRLGNVISVTEKITTIQVYEGTEGINIKDTKVILKGKPITLKLSEDMLGRIFDGTGKPIDDFGLLNSSIEREINGSPINPVSRTYPRNFIETGISSIDGLITLIRGQKLPIFSGSGINHNELTERIIRNASIKDSSKFAIVFGLMGAEFEVAQFFKKSFKESGVLSKVVMFQNLSNDPTIERILTPKVALTCAEYLAFDLGYQVLVVLSDMTSYAESLREISTLKGEIPSRKGYPGYLYSDFASIYERAGMIEGLEGSITELPILTMPNDDISHPIPDLTGYITEGQIVLGREMFQKGINPPINILDSLSRLMKDAITDEHNKISSQLFSSYSKVQDVRALAKVLGENDLSEIDKKYLVFGNEFENKFINQSKFERRTLEETLLLAKEILKVLPESELDRI